MNNIRFFSFKNSRENHTNTSLDRTLLTFLSFLSFFIWNHFFSFFLPRILAYYSRWYKSKVMLFKFFLHRVFWRLRYYCPFQKHTNSEVQKSPSQLGVFHCRQSKLRSQATNLKTQTHKTDRNPPITNHDLLNPLK